MSEESIDGIVRRVRDRLADEFMIETADIEALCVAAAQVAQLQAERDELRAIVTGLQDDILHKDETLALVERNRPVEAAFTLAKVMRECREANGQIAALTAERDVLLGKLESSLDTSERIDRELRAQLHACRAALVEACDLFDRAAACVSDRGRSTVRGLEGRLAALRSAAEGESE